MPCPYRLFVADLKYQLRNLNQRPGAWQVFALRYHCGGYPQQPPEICNIPLAPILQTV
jgi:hypothetical protein